jgi:hypothetical protein
VPQVRRIEEAGASSQRSVEAPAHLDGALRAPAARLTSAPSADEESPPAQLIQSTSAAA